MVECEKGVSKWWVVKRKWRLRACLSYTIYLILLRFTRA